MVISKGKVLLKLNLPLRVGISKNKDHICNLNNYRNMHYRVLALAKRKYTTLILKSLAGRKNMIKETPITVEYKYYHGSRRKIDLMNVISVVDKYTMDSLQKAGIIEGDDVSVIKRVEAEYIGIDKNNPRVELRIRKYIGDDNG